MVKWTMGLVLLIFIIMVVAWTHWLVRTVKANRPKRVVPVIEMQRKWDTARTLREVVDKSDWEADFSRALRK